MTSSVKTAGRQTNKRLFSDNFFRQKLSQERKFCFLSHARKNKKKDKACPPTFSTFCFAQTTQADPSAKQKELNRPTPSFLIFKKIFIHLNSNSKLKKENVKIKKYYNLAFSLILLLKTSKFQKINGIVSKTPRQSVVVALLVYLVLGRTSTTVDNLTTLFFYFKSDENVYSFNYYSSSNDSMPYQNKKRIADKKMAVDKCLC